MPRNIPSGLASHIEQGATSLCELVKITPVVGAVLAFTDHIQNLTVDGQLYLSRPGMRLSVIKSNVRMEIDNSEGAGFFQTGIITLGDILRGKFNDAFFERRFCNYDAPSEGYTFQSGYIGRVEVHDNMFKAEMRSLLAVISQPVGRVLSRRCDVRRLGDARCKFDMTSSQAPGFTVSFRQILTVTSVASQIEFQTSGMNLSGSNGSGYPDWFRGGVVHWLSGNNAEYESEIAATVAPTGLRLFNPPGLDIQGGDTLYAEAGCDRSMGHCELKFRNAAQPNGNLLNFRGFPYLIGDDLYRAGDSLALKPVPGEGT